MAEYIERDKALREIDHSLNLSEAYSKIAEIYTADVVEVVRCRDCKCFMEYTRDYARLFPTAEGADGDCYIRVMNSDDKQFCACKYDDYCSYGARKE